MRLGWQDGISTMAKKSQQGLRSVAAALDGRRLLARGSTAFVADALSVTVATLRTWVAKPPVPGLRVVISPLLYICERGDERMSGSAKELSDSIGCSISEVCVAAKRGTACHGWSIRPMRVAPYSAPQEEIDEVLHPSAF